MRKFIKDFYYTLITPEEWHTASILALGIVGSSFLTLLFIDAFFFNLPAR